MWDGASATATCRNAVRSSHKSLRVAVGVLSLSLALLAAAGAASLDGKAAAPSSPGAGAYLVKDINPGQAPSDVQRITAVRETAFFLAYDNEHGGELWKSDGTEAGTVL